mmetsp:Transcript_15440/g.23140  ORF Transcript_15440/g.23140 Transcript_15440/m.23140 type:complete len:111 (-) Transcript_15440:1182-1514(-)
MPPTESSSIKTGLGLSIISLLVIGVFSQTLASSHQLILFGGFLSALVFWGIMIALGNYRKEIRWKEVAIAEFVAVLAASFIHRVAVTSCMIFSGVLVWYTISMTSTDVGK